MEIRLDEGSRPSMTVVPIITKEKSSNEEQAEVRQEHHRGQEEVRGIHGRGKRRDARPRPGDEGGGATRLARGQGGRGKRTARQDLRAAANRSPYGQAAPRGHKSKRASPLAETLVRHARVCQGWQDRLLLPKRAEVQDEIRDARL